MRTEPFTITRQRTRTPRLGRTIDPDSHISQSSGCLCQRPAALRDEAECRINQVSLGLPTAFPVPPSPRSDPALGVWSQHALADDLPSPLEARPTGINRVQREQLCRGAQWPSMHEAHSKAALSRAASSVYDDDRIRDDWIRGRRIKHCRADLLGRRSQRLVEWIATS